MEFLTSNSIHFKVPGEPKPHPRPRATTIHGHARLYTPKSTQDRKYNIQKYAKEAYGDKAPYQGLVSMSIHFIMKRPKNKIWKTKAMPRTALSHGPDLDNMAKTVMDALNGVIYIDDRQIWYLTISKWMASGSEGPHIQVNLGLEK